MEEYLVVLHREPKTDAPQGDLSTFRFVFKKTPKSKIGTVEEPQAIATFTVRLKVSNYLLQLGRWPEVSHLNQIKLFYRFVRQHLELNGLPPAAALDLELSTKIKGAQQLAEMPHADQIQMYEGFYADPEKGNKHLIGHQHRMRTT